MAWQHWRVIDPRTTHTSDDTTYRLKLPGSNILHTLLVVTECTNGATSNVGHGMSDAVDWIKVVANGSQVLYYLEPETVRLMTLYNVGNGFEEIYNESGGAVQRAAYPIFFGRDWFDPELYLDLSHFNDLELQIKYSPTIGSDAFASGTFTTTVLGLMTLDGSPGTYQGTLVTRIIENFTTTASGDKVIEPPQRWPWRALLVRCYAPGVEDGTHIAKVEFSLNSGQRVPVELSWSELHSLNQSLLPRTAIRRGTLLRANGAVVETLLSRIKHVSLVPGVAARAAQVTGIAGDRVTIGLYDLATPTAITTSEAIRAEVVGEGLPFSIFVPLNVRDEPPYFDSDAWDEIELVLTQAQAGGDVDIVLQEVQQF